MHRNEFGKKESSYCHCPLFVISSNRNEHLHTDDPINGYAWSFLEFHFPHFRPSRYDLARMGVDNVSKIRNKIKRQELYRNSKIEKLKAKLAQRKERAQAEELDPKLKEVQSKIANC